MAAMLRGSVCQPVAADVNYTVEHMTGRDADDVDEDLTLFAIRA
jgi:hypothetical protein